MKAIVRYAGGATDGAGVLMPLAAAQACSASRAS